MTICYAQSKEEATRVAHKYWPTAALHGELTQELATPAHFEQAAKNVRAEDVGNVVVCGPDIDEHIAKIEEFARAGFDHVYVHQVGPDQESFFKFYEREILPRYGDTARRGAA
jgi:hypothetical protein